MKQLRSGTIFQVGTMRYKYRHLKASLQACSPLEHEGSWEPQNLMVPFSFSIILHNYPESHISKQSSFSRKNHDIYIYTYIYNIPIEIAQSHFGWYTVPVCSMFEAFLLPPFTTFLGSRPGYGPNMPLGEGQGMPRRCAKAFRRPWVSLIWYCVYNTYIYIHTVIIMGYDMYIYIYISYNGI